MFFSSDHRGVCIFVRGAFVAPGEWLIHATVESGSGIDSALAAAFQPRTVSQLWQAIHLERRVGRQLGATVVSVVVDGDLDVARLFAATAPASLAPSILGERGHHVPGAVVTTTGAEPAPGTV